MMPSRPKGKPCRRQCAALVQCMLIRIASAVAATGTLCIPAAHAAQGEVAVRHVTIVAISDSGATVGTRGFFVLPSGAVLAIDVARAVVRMYDSSLRGSAAVSPLPGVRAATVVPVALLPLGDSVAVYDGIAETVNVLDPLGRHVRTTATPFAARDRNSILFTGTGAPGYDMRGRFVHASYPFTRTQSPDGSPPPSVVNVPQSVAVRDSAPIVRIDPTTGRVDSVAFVRMPLVLHVSIRTPNGGVTRYTATNPLPQMDAWTMLPDGTIAIVRAHDYHIDWVHPDGARSSTPKMPFAWRRITDEEKQQLLDSTRSAHEERSRRAPWAGRGGQLPYVSLEPAHLPDYYPPLKSGTVLADRAGNVWIVPATVRGGASGGASGVVYDVVNRRGEVFERVELPVGRTIIGFGGRDVVLMASRWADSTTRLERGTIKR